MFAAVGQFLDCLPASLPTLGAQSFDKCGYHGISLVLFDYALPHTMV